MRQKLSVMEPTDNINSPNSAPVLANYDKPFVVPSQGANREGTKSEQRPAAKLEGSEILLPLLQDTAGLIGDAIHADLTGASEIVGNGLTLSRAVGTAWSEGVASHSVVLASSDGVTSLSSYALKAGGTITSSDITVDGRFDDEFLRGLGVRSAVCVPLRVHDKILGTLEFYRITKRAFTPDNARFLEIGARQLGALVRQIQDEQRGQASRRGKIKKAASEKKSDLRSSPRRKYSYRQMIAPMAGYRVPSRSEFFPVWCKDLSGSGFSLYLESPPSFHNLVVALGLPSHMRFYRAEVMRVQQVEHQGRSAFLVGCRFRGRVYL